MVIANIACILSKVFRSLTWKIQGEGRRVYLTFDDGPTPEVTEWVLNELYKFNAKATFFCLGKNAEAHPDLFKRIIQDGHAVGNHTYSHLKGFRNSVKDYCKDVDRAAELINSKLFRPPYGRILPKQLKQIRKKYKIIMWSVLSLDYNSRISEMQVVNNVTRHVKPGTIIVFHDSVKASKNLYIALPKVLEYLKENNFNPAILPQS